MVITNVSFDRSYMVSRLVGMKGHLTEIFLRSDTGLDSTSKLYIVTTTRNLLGYVFYNNIVVFSYQDLYSIYRCSQVNIFLPFYSINKNPNNVNRENGL